MGKARHLETNDGVSIVTTNYWVENLHLSFGVSIKSTQYFNGTS